MLHMVTGVTDVTDLPRRAEMPYSGHGIDAPMVQCECCWGFKPSFVAGRFGWLEANGKRWKICGECISALWALRHPVAQEQQDQEIVANQPDAVLAVPPRAVSKKRRKGKRRR